MFGNTMIRTRISGIVIFSTLMLLLVVGISVFSLTKIKTDEDSFINFASAKQKLLNDIQLNLGYGGMIHHFKNYILRGSPKYLDEFNKNVEKARADIEKYSKAGIHVAAESEAMDKVKNILEQYRKMSIMAQGEMRKGASPKEIDQLVKVDDRPALEALERLQAWQADRLDKLHKETIALADLTNAVIQIQIIVSFAAILILVLSGRVIMNSISRPLNQLIECMRDLARGGGDLTRRLTVTGRDETAILADLVNSMMENLSGLVGKVQESGIKVASSVTEIAASTREQEATATEHAATTSEVAASVKEISSTSKQLGRTTQEVADLAQGAAAASADGQALLTSLDATMNRMAKASANIADKLAALNEKAGNIGGMVTTINKVADQTNLLSLNAAIEAEKAGEYGRGFSVVATEIRRLADQTAVATYDIEQMVGEMQSAVLAGVMSMDRFTVEIHNSVEEANKAGGQLEQIIAQVQALAPHIEFVNEGLQAQVEGAGQIDEAMMNLSEAAQQTTEMIRQSNGAIAELNDAARGMQEVAAIFKVKA